MTAETDKESKEGISGDSNEVSRGVDTFCLLQESIWTIAFIRDVALAHAMNAEEDHVGITPEGEQGLGLILASVGRDLETVYDNI